MKKHDKFELAENQLKTAIALLLGGGDMLSSATLARSADVILCQLVINHGKENFTEYSLRKSMEEGMEEKTRQQHGAEINSTLKLNDIRKMDKGEDGFVYLNIEETTVGAISKALANYDMLSGRDRGLVDLFLHWCQQNLDHKKYNVFADPEWEGVSENGN